VSFIDKLTQISLLAGSILGVKISTRLNLSLKDEDEGVVDTRS
jgi:hypothetical protein